MSARLVTQHSHHRLLSWRKLSSLWWRNKLMANASGRKVVTCLPDLDRGRPLVDWSNSTVTHQGIPYAPVYVVCIRNVIICDVVGELAAADIMPPCGVGTERVVVLSWGQVWWAWLDRCPNKWSGEGIHDHYREEALTNTLTHWPLRLQHGWTCGSLTKDLISATMDRCSEQMSAILVWATHCEKIIPTTFKQVKLG